MGYFSVRKAWDSGGSLVISVGTACALMIALGLALGGPPGAAAATTPSWPPTIDSGPMADGSAWAPYNRSEGSWPPQAVSEAGAALWAHTAGPVDSDALIQWEPAAAPGAARAAAALWSARCWASAAAPALANRSADGGPLLAAARAYASCVGAAASPPEAWEQGLRAEPSPATGGGGAGYCAGWAAAGALHGSAAACANATASCSWSARVDPDADACADPAGDGDNDAYCAVCAPGSLPSDADGACVPVTVRGRCVIDTVGGAQCEASGGVWRHEHAGEALAVAPDGSPRRHCVLRGVHTREECLGAMCAASHQRALSHTAGAHSPVHCPRYCWDMRRSTADECARLAVKGSRWLAGPDIGYCRRADGHHTTASESAEKCRSAGGTWHPGRCEVPYRHCITGGKGPDPHATFRDEPARTWEPGVADSESACTLSRVFEWATARRVELLTAHKGPLNEAGAPPSGLCLGAPGDPPCGATGPLARRIPVDGGGSVARSDVAWVYGAPCDVVESGWPAKHRPGQEPSAGLSMMDTASLTALGAHGGDKGVAWHGLNASHCLVTIENAAVAHFRYGRPEDAPLGWAPAVTGGVAAGCDPSSCRGGAGDEAYRNATIYGDHCMHPLLGCAWTANLAIPAQYDNESALCAASPFTVCARRGNSGASLSLNDTIASLLSVPDLTRAGFDPSRAGRALAGDPRGRPAAGAAGTARETLALSPSATAPFWPDLRAGPGRARRAALYATTGQASAAGYRAVWTRRGAARPNTHWTWSNTSDAASAWRRDAGLQGALDDGADASAVAAAALGVPGRAPAAAWPALEAAASADAFAAAAAGWVLAASSSPLDAAWEPRGSDWWASVPGSERAMLTAYVWTVPGPAAPVGVESVTVPESAAWESESEAGVPLTPVYLVQHGSSADTEGTTAIVRIRTFPGAGAWAADGGPTLTIQCSVILAANGTGVPVVTRTDHAASDVVECRYEPPNGAGSLALSARALWGPGPTPAPSPSPTAPAGQAREEQPSEPAPTDAPPVSSWQRAQGSDVEIFCGGGDERHGYAVAVTTTAGNRRMACQCRQPFLPPDCTLRACRVGGRLVGFGRGDDPCSCSAPFGGHYCEKCAFPAAWGGDGICARRNADAPWRLVTGTPAETAAILKRAADAGQSFLVARPGARGGLDCACRPPLSGDAARSSHGKRYLPPFNETAADDIVAYTQTTYAISSVAADTMKDALTGGIRPGGSSEPAENAALIIVGATVAACLVIILAYEVQRAWMSSLSAPPDGSAGGGADDDAFYGDPASTAAAPAGASLIGRIMRRVKATAAASSSPAAVRIGASASSGARRTGQVVRKSRGSAGIFKRRRASNRHHD